MDNYTSIRRIYMVSIEGILIILLVVFLVARLEKKGK